MCVVHESGVCVCACVWVRQRACVPACVLVRACLRAGGRAVKGIWRNDGKWLENRWEMWKMDGKLKEDVWKMDVYVCK